MDLLFDLDGTLTDPREGIVRSFEHAVKQLGLPPVAPARLEGFIGPPIQESFLELLGPARRAEVPAAVNFYREYFGTLGLFENKVYPGISELLAELKDRGHRIRLATSKPTVFAMRVLDHFGLSQHFVSRDGSELDGTRVKKGELLRYVLSEYGLRSAKTVMIGDRKHDVLAAQEHGLASVGVGYGYGSREELEAAGATWYCPTLALVRQRLLEFSV